MRAELEAIMAGFGKLPSLSGNAGKMVIVNALATALGVSALTFPASGALATTQGVQTFSNKRTTLRTASLPDAVSITPDVDAADQANHVNTQGAGTLTFNAPIGTASDMDVLVVRVKSTAAHALSFNAVYRGSTDFPLPLTLSGGSKIDYFAFRRHHADSKWDLIGIVQGFA